MNYNAMGVVKLLFLTGTHITCNLINLGKPQVEEHLLNVKLLNVFPYRWTTLCHYYPQGGSTTMPMRQSQCLLLLVPR